MVKELVLYDPTEELVHLHALQTSYTSYTHGHCYTLLSVHVIVILEPVFRNPNVMFVLEKKFPFTISTFLLLTVGVSLALLW